MYILLFINFLLLCIECVFLFNQLKEKEDDIEELYDLYYKHLEEEESFKNKNREGKVIKIDRRIF